MLSHHVFQQSVCNDLTHFGLVTWYGSINLRQHLLRLVACYLMAPSCYLNHCWFLMSEFLWHLPEINFTVSFLCTVLYNEFENHTFEIIAIFDTGQRARIIRNILLIQFIRFHINQNLYKFILVTEAILSSFDTKYHLYHDIVGSFPSQNPDILLVHEQTLLTTSLMNLRCGEISVIQCTVVLR